MLDHPVGGDVLPSDLFAVDELSLYRRQLVLPEVGIHGQAALKRARVLVVGAGGLGCPVLLYLAAAGIGVLGIVEFDTVERTNLHRQVIYGDDAVGRPKAEVARERLLAAYPTISVALHRMQLDGANAAGLVAGYDVMVDCTDNFTARYALNDACVHVGKPVVSASILRFEGQLSVFGASDGPCYRCLFPDCAPTELAPSCAEAGVMGVLPGIMGCLQANEVLKLVLRIGRPLIGRLLTLDAMAMQFREFSVARNPACAACAPGGDAPAHALAAVPPASAHDLPVREIDPPEVQGLVARDQSIVLVDVRTATERQICRIGHDVFIPLTELDDRAAELPQDAQIVCYCHLGGRSRQAAALLQRHGFAHVASMRGGIDAWSRQINPHLARY